MSTMLPYCLQCRILMSTMLPCCLQCRATEGISYLCTQEVQLPGCGIVLLHPYEGGVFSFRLIMRALAEDVGCPVLTFDRPGAGLVKPVNTSTRFIANECCRKVSMIV